ncbi:MAG: hypothetical protein WA865_09045 [Spirulinaceae cyanobacterium]
MKVCFFLTLISVLGFMGICSVPSSGEICSPSNGGGAGVGQGSHSQGNENITQECKDSQQAFIDNP